MRCGRQRRGVKTRFIQNEAEIRMKAFIRTLSLFLAVAVAGCGGSSSIITTPTAFLFFVGQGANIIQAFKEVPSGHISGNTLYSFPTRPVTVAMALPPS